MALFCAPLPLTGKLNRHKTTIPTTPPSRCPLFSLSLRTNKLEQAIKQSQEEFKQERANNNVSLVFRDRDLPQSVLPSARPAPPEGSSWTKRRIRTTGRFGTSSSSLAIVGPPRRRRPNSSSRSKRRSVGSFELGSLARSILPFRKDIRVYRPSTKDGTRIDSRSPQF